MAKILVVDDEPEFRMVIIAYLKSFFTGEIHEAENGQAALEKLMDNSYALAIVDLKMPVMSGIELVIKMSEKKLKTPSIIVTGFSDLETAQRAWVAGISEYLTKPVDPIKFQDMVELTLENILSPENRLESDLGRKLFRALNLVIPKSLFDKFSSYADEQKKSMTSMILDLMKKEVGPHEE